MIGFVKNSKKSRKRDIDENVGREKRRLDCFSSKTTYKHVYTQVESIYFTSHANIYANLFNRLK